MTQRTCSINGCDKPHHARGWCKVHYKAWWKHGDPAGAPARPAQICAIEDCTRPARSRKWCAMHYMRWYTNGVADRPTLLIIGDNEARFWSKVDKRGPDECWPWIGGGNKLGYGIFAYRENGETKSPPAGRWLLGYLRGRPLERSEEACHRCDNPPCVNPAHLYIGTHKQNMRDMGDRRRPVPRCINGHECVTCAAEREARAEESFQQMEAAIRLGAAFAGDL